MEELRNRKSQNGVHPDRRPLNPLSRDRVQHTTRSHPVKIVTIDADRPRLPFSQLLTDTDREARLLCGRSGFVDIESLPIEVKNLTIAP